MLLIHLFTVFAFYCAVKNSVDESIVTLLLTVEISCDDRTLLGRVASKTVALSWPTL